jgi:hypothetical protein
MDNISVLISELGVPVTVALMAGAGLWFTVRWLQSLLMRRLDELEVISRETASEMLRSTQKEESVSREILIKLIDRIRALQTDVVRLDTMFRIKHKLPVDERRIQRNQKED